MTERADVIEINVVDDDDLSLKTKKKTSPCMTKFEYARLINARAIQISITRSSPELESEELLDPIEIATKELQNRTMKWAIVRTLPNGTQETWHIRDMDIRNY